MKNDKIKQFNIISFVIKTAIVVVSIVVSLFVLILSEQYAIAIRGVMRSDGINNLFRFSEKDFERLISAITPNFIILKLFSITFARFATFLFAGAIAAVYFFVFGVLKGMVKSTNIYTVKQNKEVKTIQNYTTKSVFYNVNLKLTI